MSLPDGRVGALTLSAATERFLAEPHVGVLTTLRPGGSPHVAPVRFTWDAAAGLVRVLTVASSRKARNVAADQGGRAALCQVVGYRWVTFEGSATVIHEHDRIAEGVVRYTGRYGSPPPEPADRVVVEIVVDRVLMLNT